MNLQEYISSGIIESYVLGLASQPEREEFERMCNAYPEVNAARDAFEAELEAHALANATGVPADLKSRVLAAVDADKLVSPSQAPVLPMTPKAGKTVAMFAWQRSFAAAAVVLLLISTALNFYFFNKYRSYNDKYEQLLASQTELAANNQIMQTRLLDYERTIDHMKDPKMFIVKMPANPKGPDPTSLTTVYWDTVSKDVYLTVNQLPRPSDDEQYQLWAMVDGKPVDAGVFELKEGPALMKMKNIPRAEAFAVTLEKKGGSPVPHMDKLYVIGKV